MVRDQPEAPKGFEYITYRIIPVKNNLEICHAEMPYTV